MSTQPISQTQLRQRLRVVLDCVHDQFQQFRVMCKDKFMARIVNEDYMRAIEQLIQDDPGLADTLALMLNDEAQAIIAESEHDLAAGRLIPLDQALA